MSFISPPKQQSFEEAFEAIDLGMTTFWFSHYPNILSEQLTPRIKLAAKRLSLAGGIQRCKAHEAIAQALRFDSWHALSSHLRMLEEVPIERLPPNWLDNFSAVGVLLIEAKDEVALPRSQINAFDRFAETISMLTDVPKQVILDGVAAPLCAGKTWAEVRARTPLQAKTPLYSFVTPDGEMSGDLGGCFSQSSACVQLADQLDERWLSNEHPSKAQRNKARRWISKVLLAQPGFLEGGLALAWILHEEGDPGALAMANRLVKQADSLIPKGYRGRVIWGHTSNRFYHRLLWLQLKLNFLQGNLSLAARLGRRMLRLNPNDNVGVRYVLPLILLECGDNPGAKRALKSVADESGLTVAAVRAFVHFALGDIDSFRKELALALFTLPVLRTFLLNDPNALPASDEGYRGTIPDVETFAAFAWPAYCAIPGLRGECHSFLAEPLVLAAEKELLEYWEGYWQRDREQGKMRRGSLEGWNLLIDASVQRVSRR